MTMVKHYVESLARHGSEYEDLDRRARRRGVLLFPPAESEYLGVHVPTDYLRRRVEKPKLWEPVSEGYLADVMNARKAIPRPS